MGYKLGMSPHLELSTRMVNFRPPEINNCYGMFPSPQNEKQIMQMS